MKILSKLPQIAAWIAGLCMLCLVLLMSIEVFLRYVLGSPTIYSYDIAVMLNGTIFLFGIGYALHQGAHVKVDVLSSKLPPRAVSAGYVAVLVLVLIPAFVATSWVALESAMSAYAIGKRELASIWGPKVWPFYTTIFLGLALFALQLVVTLFGQLSILFGAQANSSEAR